MKLDFYWVYDIPNWLFASLVMFSFITFSMVGLWLSRRSVVRFFGRHLHNDLVSFYLAAAGVFYGITLGLIAVGTYTQYAQVDSAVSNEASAVAALYRDVNSYPEPDRSRLRNLIERYTSFVIEQEWPLQREGIVDRSSMTQLTDLQQAFDEFKPNRNIPKEQVVHAEALNMYNHMLELNEIRHQSVTAGLPQTLYIVLIAGAALNIIISWLFVVDNLKLHVVLNLLMAALLGLLVYLIAAMDNPFRGKVSIGPDAFESVRSLLMKPSNLRTGDENQPHLIYQPKPAVPAR